MQKEPFHILPTQNLLHLSEQSKTVSYLLQKGSVQTHIQIPWQSPVFLLAVVCDLDLVALTFLTDDSHDDPNCKLYLKLNKYMTAISTVCCCSDQTVYVGKKAKTFSSLLWRATFAFVSVKILDFLTNQIPKLKTWEKILENCCVYYFFKLVLVVVLVLKLHVLDPNFSMFSKLFG